MALVGSQTALFVAPGQGLGLNPQRRDGWVGETGLVVGPDQRWFPNPHSVWVKFGSGLTILIAVTDLIIVPADGDAEQATPPN